MEEPKKVKITNPTHIYMMGMSGGLMAAVDTLEAMSDAMKGVPGFQLALASVRAVASERRADSISKNLAALARAGIDVSHHKAVSFDPTTAEMVCEFYEPDLFE